VQACASKAARAKQSGVVALLWDDITYQTLRPILRFWL